MRLGLVVLALVLGAAAAAEPAVVGRAVALGVEPVGLAGLPPVLEGRLLPVRAEVGGAVGQIALRHPTALGRETYEVATAVARWMASEACHVPGLRAAFGERGVVVRFETGGRPVDGGSAGVAMAVAAASVLLDRPVRQDVVWTGQVLPDGRVAPIAGLSYKFTAALVAGMRDLYAPTENALALVRGDPTAPALLRMVAMEEVEPAVADALELDSAVDVRARLAHGLAAFRAGEMPVALDDLAWCAGRRPDDLTAALWLDRARFAAGLPAARPPLAAARVALWQDRFDEAEVALRQADADPLAVEVLRRAVAEARARRRCSDCLSRMASALDAGDLEAAGAAFREAERLEPLPADSRACMAAAAARMALARRRSEAHDRPGDAAAWRRYASAAEESEDWDALLEAGASLAAMGPDPDAGYFEARALLAGGERDDAAVRLLGHLLEWPAHSPSRELLADVGIDVIAPWVRGNLAADRPLSGRSLLHFDAADSIEPSVWIDGGRAASQPRDGAWRWETTGVADGPHEVTAVATDAAGNLGWKTWLATVRNGRGTDEPAAGQAPQAEPFEVPVCRPGVWVARPGDHVWIDGARLYATALLAAGLDPPRLNIGATALAQPAVPADRPLELPRSLWLSQVLELAVWSQADDGRSLGGQEIRVVRRAELPAWLRAGAGRVELVVDHGVDVAAAWVLADDLPARLCRADALLVPAGARRVQAVAVTRDGWHHATPPLELPIR